MKPETLKKMQAQRAVLRAQVENLRPIANAAHTFGLHDFSQNVEYIMAKLYEAEEALNRIECEIVADDMDKAAIADRLKQEIVKR